MSKYQKYYHLMLEQNSDVFARFKHLHDKYETDTVQYQKEFNELGRDVQDIIRDWEGRLCSHSENSGFGKFSTSLSDKFWDEIRKNFPKIDHIGLLT